VGGDLVEVEERECIDLAVEYSARQNYPDNNDHRVWVHFE
jgi:hypothetical protein